jgi:hypothetical protein
VADTLEWDRRRGRPELRAGPSSAEEEALLEAWHKERRLGGLP